MQHHDDHMPSPIEDQLHSRVPHAATRRTAKSSHRGDTMAREAGEGRSQTAPFNLMSMLSTAVMVG